MKTLFLAVMLSFSLSANANVDFQYSATAKLLFEKLLAKAKPEAGKREYEVVKTGLVRCQKIDRDAVSYSCMDYFDNGQHPVFTKYTAVDLYKNGMAKIPENQFTDFAFEKRAKLTCSRIGDEGVYTYKCKVEEVKISDEAHYFHPFRDGDYNAENFYLRIFADRASAESIWIGGDGRTYVCGMDFSIHYREKNILSATEVRMDSSPDSDACVVQFIWNEKWKSLDVAYESEFHEQVCKKSCNTAAEVARNGLKYQR